MHFEQEFPEEAKILAELCKERAKAKAKGKRIQPIILTDEFLDSDMPLIVTPIIAENKIGRNDPCICGSGKKFKKCCNIP